jgi:hypothetical protein
MALVLETTVNTTTVTIPSGYTAPSTSNTFTDPSLVRDTYTMAASTVEHATPSTGLTNIVTAVNTYVSGTYVPTVLGLETTANTINAICTITAVSRNNGSSIYSNTDNIVVAFEMKWEKV